jgi:hypothetical protein
MMQVSHDTTDTRPSAPKPVDRVKAPTRLSDIEAAADFERWLDRAQAATAVELPAADKSAASSNSTDEATAAAKEGKGDADAGDDGSLGDGDSEQDVDPRFAQPAWAAQSFGAGMPELAPAQAPAPLAWAEIAAQIERLLITDPAGRPDGAAALFRLAPELLRDTTVALSRTAQGWLLRIDSQDARLRVDSTRHEAALRERFAKGGLGDLVIEEGELPDLGL